MAALESLPPDQRAVLQLVLQRGHNYNEIAKMLSIDRAAVRERALSAFDALGPHTRLAPERRALITDYLLGQLPERLGQQTRDHLARTPGERAWARVVASELAPLARSPLPEIPVDSGEELEIVGTTEAAEPAGTEAAPAAEPEPAARVAREPRPGVRPASRRGGAIVLGLAALAVVVALVIVILATGGSSSKRTASTSSASSQPSTTPSRSTRTQLIAQVNLISPTGNKNTAGLAQVVRQASNTGLVIVAQGVPANTSHDAYAVWLYNSPSDSHILGFVNPGVRANGRLQTAGVLPANASHYKQLLITLETRAKPQAPGKIVLEGALRFS